VAFLADRGDIRFILRVVCLCDVCVLWLDIQTDRVGFWREGYDRGQPLCITRRWGVALGKVLVVIMPRSAIPAVAELRALLYRSRHIVGWRAAASWSSALGHSVGKRTR